MQRVFSFLVVLLAATAATAEGAVPKSLTLIQLISAALADNPNLLAARTKWEAMKNKPEQAGALTNPMFTFRGMDMADGGDFPDTNEKRYEVEQAFPWFGKRGLQRQAAEKEAEAMQYEYETIAHDMVVGVKETYYELCSVQQVLKITLDEADVLKRLETAAQSLYASGQSGQQDMLKAQAETTILKPRILDLEAQINALKSKLNILLGRSADAPIDVAAPSGFPEVDKDADTLRAIAEENRPEIEQAGANLARAQIERRLMGREYFPDYRLGVEYRTFRNEDPNMVMFTVGIDIPVWQSKYRAGIREAERLTASSRAALKASRQQAGLDVQQAYFNVKSARAALDLYRNTLIPQAQSRFDASEASYRGGTVSFLDLLDSQRFLLNARVMAAMAESNLGMQIARLERALGTDLQPGSSESAPVAHQGAEHE